MARLSQSLWITTPKNFYHPNQLSIRCVVESFNSWWTVLVSRRAGLTSLTCLELVEAKFEHNIIDIRFREKQLSIVLYYSHKSYMYVRCLMIQLHKGRRSDEESGNEMIRFCKYIFLINFTHIFFIRTSNFSINILSKFMISNLENGLN